MVEKAQELFKEARKENNPYDRVFCVFDRDEHSTFEDAKNTLARSKERNEKNELVFQAIFSIPCFEYWILLHYEYTTRPFVREGKKSPCDTAISRIKSTSDPKYKKSDTDVFNRLFDKLETAKANARKSVKASETGDEDHPVTHIHVLVDYLQNLKK